MFAERFSRKEYMFNAVKEPGTILLLGGTSDIGLAIVAALSKHSPLKVILAARPNSVHLEHAKKFALEHGAHSVETIAFDAEDLPSHPETIDAAFSHGDIDIAIVAFGILPNADQVWRDHQRACTVATVNYTAGVSVGVLLAEKFLDQGHGQIIALSSVAGELVRKSNFFYGSTKAGFDAFYQGLGYQLEPHGIKTLVVRPGQVRTKMTEGLAQAPLTVDIDQVATEVVDAMRNGKTLLWVPPLFRIVMSILRHLPKKILRKLPI